MGALQPFHLIVILIVVLIVFGPGKLTELGSQLGKGVKEFRQLSEGGDGHTDAAVGRRFCTECGAAASSAATFCTGCGHAMASTESKQN
jgi:sec-independent protein translocase protein TatA